MTDYSAIKKRIKDPNVEKNSNEILIPKCRGRPRKIPTSENQSKQSTDTLKIQIGNNNMITDVPKRRGRPRKDS